MIGPELVGRDCPSARAADTKGSGALGRDTPYLEAHGEGWGEGDGGDRQTQSFIAAGQTQ